MALKFELDDIGDWLAPSRFGTDGDSFSWRIQITQDGMFDVRDSSSELLSFESPMPFSLFSAAVGWCNSQEKLITVAHQSYEQNTSQQTLAEVTGMSKLDVFASQALIAIYPAGRNSNDGIASECYDIAEAMLAESERRQKK